MQPFQRFCSDIQALKLEEGASTVKDIRANFIRQKLSKKSYDKVWIKSICFSFSDRLIVDKIWKERKPLTGKKQKFLQKKYPKICYEHHKPPVPCQTMSRWIVNTIKIAYDDNLGMRVKGHSKRSDVLSWTLFVSSTLNLAERTAETPFIKNITWSVNIQVWKH